MSNARNLANLLGTGTQITTADIADGAFQANKNLIINGAMQVAQRGTSFTPSGVTHCLDRFAHYASSPPSNAVQQSTDVPTGEGFEYSLFMDTVDLRHAVELPAANKAGVFYSGQKLTLSFWAKTGTSTHSPTINMQFIDGAAFGSASSAFSSSNNSIVITGSWQRFSIQYTVDTTPTASHYACGFSIGGTANILYITGIQLELGDTATPFEHRTYGDELARCQRYAIKLTEFNGNKMREYDRYRTFSYVLPVEMRATPTVPSMSTTDGATCTIGNATNRGFVVNSVAPGDGYTAYVTSQLVVDAEL